MGRRIAFVTLRMSMVNDCLFTKENIKLITLSRPFECSFACSLIGNLNENLRDVSGRTEHWHGRLFSCPPEESSLGDRITIVTGISKMLRENVTQESPSSWMILVFLHSLRKSQRPNEERRFSQLLSDGSDFRLLANKCKWKEPWKTEFIISYGLYEFKVTLFGLCNTPASFEKSMDTAFPWVKCRHACDI